MSRHPWYSRAANLGHTTPINIVPYLLLVAKPGIRCELELALTRLHIRCSSNIPTRADTDVSRDAMPHSYFASIYLWGACSPFVCSSCCWLPTPFVVCVLVVVADLLAASLLGILDSVWCRGFCWTLQLWYHVKKQKFFCYGCSVSSEVEREIKRLCWTQKNRKVLLSSLASVLT